MNKDIETLRVEEECKVCVKCLLLRPMSDFGKTSRNKNVYETRCKQCARNSAKESRLKNIEFCRDRDRARSKSILRKKLATKTAKQQRLLHPKETRAREIAREAVRRGKIEKYPCFSCGDIRTEAHHAIYEMPLDVIWLCRKCHVQLHNDHNAAIAAKEGKE